MGYLEEMTKKTIEDNPFVVYSKMGCSYSSKMKSLLMLSLVMIHGLTHSKPGILYTEEEHLCIHESGTCMQSDVKLLHACKTMGMLLLLDIIPRFLGSECGRQPSLRSKPLLEL